jgi:hypothetical protein
MAVSRQPSAISKEVFDLIRNLFAESRMLKAESHARKPRVEC